MARNTCLGCTQYLLLVDVLNKFIYFDKDAMLLGRYWYVGQWWSNVYRPLYSIDFLIS